MAMAGSHRRALWRSQRRRIRPVCIGVVQFAVLIVAARQAATLTPEVPAWISPSWPAWSISQPEWTASRLVRRRASEAPESALWKEAYDVELERYTLLRDQIDSMGISEDSVVLPEPEECTIDWSDNYSKLSECNKALEFALEKHAVQVLGQSSAQERKKMMAVVPNILYVTLQGRPAVVELSRFFGENAAFYMVEATLPLGMNVTTVRTGKLKNAFVVQQVMPGGSAKAGGIIMPGDVLQAVSAVSSRSAARGAQASSSAVPKQTLVDCAFLTDTKALFEAIQSNLKVGDNVSISLIFERDLSVSPPPPDPLTPQPRRF